MTPSKTKLPALILMTDSIRLPDPMPAVAALPRKSAVILRHYNIPERHELAEKLAVLCKQRELYLLIAADARLALTVKANGLHLPETMAKHGPDIWRNWKRPDWIVTASAHSPGALCQARRCGADAALLSPVFKTSSHANARVLGSLLFAKWRRSAPLAVYALGGITTTNAKRLTASGHAGFAAIAGLSV